MSDITDGLTGQTVLVTGGTGSFGKAIVKHLVEKKPEIEEIRIFWAVYKTG